LTEISFETVVPTFEEKFDIEEWTAKGFTIVTRGLGKKFGDVVAVKNLNLYVKKGERYGLIGPNGSGKTTTVRILKGIFPPTYGQAFVGGYDVLKDKKIVRGLTSLLPETPSVYERLTPWEFLDFISGLYNIEDSIVEKRIERLLSLFDLMDRSDDLLQSFSKGMRQKVLIASTLINDPEIIFFDEPLAGLDPPAAKMVKDLILALTSDAGKTVFVCSHMLKLAEEICDRVGILSEGELLAVGTPVEIMKMTETSSLEEAFLALLPGKMHHKDLLSWRE